MVRPQQETAEPGACGVDAAVLQRLYERIGLHIESGWYPGAAFAMARHGKLVANRAFGTATISDDKLQAKAATEETLWLLYSQTKPVVSSAIWVLAERGLVRFHDAVTEYIPDFARFGKA